MGIVIRLCVSAAALWLATLFVEGIKVTADTTAGNIATLLVVSAIFGLVNAVLRPIIKLVGCVFYLLTLGLIALVVNGALFLFTSWIADQVGLPFQVDGFWDAVLGALIVGVVSWLLNLVIPDGRESD